MFKNGLVAAAAVLAMVVFAPPSFASSSHHDSHGRCTGVCFGAASKHTGHPRNKFVHGYKTKGGTHVKAYSRAKRH